MVELGFESVGFHSLALRLGVARFWSLTLPESHCVTPWARSYSVTLPPLQENGVNPSLDGYRED